MPRLPAGQDLFPDQGLAAFGSCCGEWLHHPPPARLNAHDHSLNACSMQRSPAGTPHRAALSPVAVDPCSVVCPLATTNRWLPASPPAPQPSRWPHPPGQGVACPASGAEDCKLYLAVLSAGSLAAGASRLGMLSTVMCPPLHQPGPPSGLAPCMPYWAAGAHAGGGQAASGRAAALPKRPAGLRHHCKVNRRCTADWFRQAGLLEDSTTCILRSHGLTKFCRLAGIAALGCCHNSPPPLVTCLAGRRQEGVAALWTGIGPNIARNVAVSTSALASYDQVGLEGVTRGLSLCMPSCLELGRHTPASCAPGIPGCGACRRKRMPWRAQAEDPFAVHIPSHTPARSRRRSLKWVRSTAHQWRCSPARR